jgi:hypothetical protein
LNNPIITNQPIFQLSGIWAAITIIIGLILVLITIYFIVVLITNKAKNLSIGKKVDINFEENKNDSCINQSCNPDKLTNIIMRYISIYSSITYEKNASIEEQINYLEQKINYIREYDLKCYLELLSNKMNKREDLLVKSDDYQNYINIIYRVYIEVFQTFKTFLKENHLHTYSTISWVKYKNERIKFLISKMNRDLSFAFTPTLMQVSRKDLHDNLDKILTPYIKTGFEEIFDEAKRIALERLDNIEKLKDELKSFSTETCGTNINITEEI